MPPLERAALLEGYPWLRPHGEPERVVMGDDLDAALSTALYLHLHPEAQLVGVYAGFQRVLHSAQLEWDEVLGALWLDLDIHHPACRSLGHHILHLAPGEELPALAQSCNPNTLTGRCLDRSFTRKYPLGTVHFLLWLYDLDLPRGRHADLLLWLADSTYINAQSQSWKKNWKDAGAGEWVLRRGFRENVRDWLFRLMPHPPLQAGFAALDTPAFEERMARFQEEVLGRARFVQGKGQAASRHRQCYGWQCQPPEGADLVLHLRQLLALVAQHTGWHLHPGQIAPLQETVTRAGRRELVRVETVRREGLASFLERRRIFSYVFQSRRTLNYTTGL